MKIHIIGGGNLDVAIALELSQYAKDRTLRVLILSLNRKNRIFDINL